MGAKCGPLPPRALNLGTPLRPLFDLTPALVRSPVHLSSILLTAPVRRRLPWLLLLAAALCFVGGYLASRYGQAPGVVQRTDVARLQQLVRRAEATAAREADTVAAQLRRGPYSFQRLIAETSYPTCVLERGTLRYWSDATLRPETEAAARGRPARAFFLKRQFVSVGTQRGGVVAGDGRRARICGQTARQIRCLRVGGGGQRRALHRTQTFFERRADRRRNRLRHRALRLSHASRFKPRFKRRTDDGFRFAFKIVSAYRSAF